MKKNTIVLLVCAGLVALMAFIYIGMRFSYRNAEVSLRNLAKAQQEQNKVIYDKTWKTISQRAQITDKYEQAFKDIYSRIMDARYKDENLLFKFVTEQNPTLSPDLYRELADAVESNRLEFANVQKRLLDIKREHDNLRMRFPGSWFVGDRPELVLQIVTSTKTEKTFATGKEDDIQLFK